MSSESDKKNHRPGFLPPEFERSATAVDNGRRRWPNPSLQALVPQDLSVKKILSSPAHPVNTGPTKQEPSSPALPIEGRRTMNAKQGRGLGVQPPGRADIMAIATIRYLGGEGADGGDVKKEENAHAPAWTFGPNKRLAHQVLSQPPNPSHTRLGWGRGIA